MTSPYRAETNRHNANRSTGPKTAAGKARVAANALRHGLSIPISCDPKIADKIDRLAAAFVGADARPDIFVAARRIAEAQLDLIRVREARLQLFGDESLRWSIAPIKEFGRLGVDAVRIVVRAYKYQAASETPPDAYWKRYDRLSSRRAKLDRFNSFVCAETPSLGHCLGVLSRRLTRLDRYEQRAISRRKRAMREFQALQQK